MSLFNLLKKKEQGPVIDDKTWMNQTGKLKGCAALLKEHPAYTLVAWLLRTKEEAAAYLFREYGLSPVIETATSVMPSRIQGKEICFLEHHPQLGKELNLLKSWKCEKVLFLNSLEDAVFYHSKPERIIELMQRLGHQENEVIQHPMVTKSIRRAQQKFDKEGIKDLPKKYGEWLWV
ncbi:MAG: hypothetical protein AAFZ15_18350 [Bacteroidota bacterium]